MSTIVTNVKERLRSRSRHRYSTRGSSIDDTRPPLPSVAINGWQHANGYDLPKSLRQEALAEPGPQDELISSPTRNMLPEIPQGNGLGLDPSLLAQAMDKTTASPNFPQSPTSQQPVPDRTSSLRSKHRPYTSAGASYAHRRTVSQPVHKTSVNTAALLDRHPDRPQTSRPKTRHIPIASTSPKLGQYEAEVAARESAKASPVSASSLTPSNSNSRKFPPRKDSLEHAERPRGRVPGHRTGRSLDFAPYDPYPLIPRFRDDEHEQQAHAATRKALKLPDNIRLPADFKLESYVRTNVSTEWLPAVTQEKVVHQKTEIIQKAITRDIHVHHYYEYFQPIKVVEILPAKHWFLDPATGKRMEIPEPTGWKMPENLAPTKPDTSSVRKKTRHYLVDDEFPKGKEEPASEPFDAPVATGSGVNGRRVSVGSATAATAA